MAVRIPWDKYEAAILLEAWIEIKNNSSLKRNIIKRVSGQLRQKAVIQGIEIDNVFRNENGISFQIQSMASAFEQTFKGQPASKLFNQIVELYHKDYSSYLSLLREAKKMCNNDEYNDISSNDIHDSEETNNSKAVETLNINSERFHSILLDNYSKGFRLNDKLSLKRLKIQWYQKFNEELNCDDNDIYSSISQITIQYGDMAYLPEAMMDEKTKEKLITYIKSVFTSGKTSIYYEALYKEFSDDFLRCHINNVGMLKSFLTYINDDSMYLQKDYITADISTNIDINEEIKNYLINQNCPVKTEKIYSDLSHIPNDKIFWIIGGHNSQEFVRNQQGEYFHADIIDFSDFEIETIKKWINAAIDDKEYMGGQELTETIFNQIPAINERYPFITWLGLRDVIAYKLKNQYSFKGKIISEYGKELSMKEVFSSFAKNHKHFTLTQLDMLKRDLGTTIYFDSIYENSLRINKEEFVSKDQANFDVVGTDSAIDKFCCEEFVPIKEISIFGAFPNAYFPWNQFLLEQYVANYSEKYKLLHTGYNSSDPVGAIVKKASNINTFDDVITLALANSNVPLNSVDALQFLCDVGFLARKKYSNIEYVITKANLLRSKGE